MESKENLDIIFDNFLEPEENIEKGLAETKEIARVNSFINKLKLFDNNKDELTKVYTSILEDENVVFVLTKISQNNIFVKHFPEFFVVNEYGENVINCQQNSKFHKYGVFRHILATIESVGSSQNLLSKNYISILKWTMFLHDIGKPYVKVVNEDGTDSFQLHEDKSYELAKEILNRFTFSDEDKYIILKLIKYHDKYINEGEITDENMKFLASELNNSKQLFDFLLEVKDADARAKSLEVYNKFKIVKNKYMEFIDKYFSYNNDKDMQVNEKNSVAQSISEEMTQIELDELLNKVIMKKALKSLYQPVVDLKKQEVHGYEEFTRIESNKKINILDFFNRALEAGKFEKVQQTLFINGIETFETITTKESNRLFINADFNSYEKYVNKPRIYEMMSKTKIVIEFQNYDKVDIQKLQNTIDIIHKNGGLVALDKYGVTKLRLDEINMLNIDYIVADVSLIKNINNDLERQKFISDLITYAISRDIEIIIVGIESKETLYTVKKLGARYVQGFYFAKPDYKISMINESVKEKLNDSENDMI